MTQKNKIYIAGPMTGYENYNYPKFFKIESILKEKGWIVINPARITDDFGGQNVFLSDLNAQKTILFEQQTQLMNCNAILLLDGWQKSVGSKIELQIALKHNLDIYIESELV